jgi:hypothetical protein
VLKVTNTNKNRRVLASTLPRGTVCRVSGELALRVDETWLWSKFGRVWLVALNGTNSWSGDDEIWVEPVTAELIVE